MQNSFTFSAERAILKIKKRAPTSAGTLKIKKSHERHS